MKPLGFHILFLVGMVRARLEGVIHKLPTWVEGSKPQGGDLALIRDSPPSGYL